MSELAAQTRLTVGIVGVGRAGCALGRALAAAGHRVIAVHAVSQSSRARAAEWFPAARVVPINDVASHVELLLLTVPDDALPAIAAGVAATGAVPSGQFVVHASGRYGIGVLDPLASRGAAPLALHPAMTLTGTSTDLQRLAGCPFAITSPESLRPVAEALVLEMGGEPLWVPEEARTLYHAGLAHAANHLVTLLADSMDLLAGAGVERPDRLLAPLVTAAMDNALRHGDAALTGPVARGDSGTVAAHVAAIGETELLPSYLALARRTASRALASGLLTPEKGAKLLHVLATQSAEPGAESDKE